MQRSTHEPGEMSGGDAPQDVHRYDSFVVRLWSRGEGEEFGRAEVRHVQSDVVSTGTTVGLDWVEAEIRRHLRLHEEP